MAFFDFLKRNETKTASPNIFNIGVNQAWSKPKETQTKQINKPTNIFLPKQTLTKPDTNIFNMQVSNARQPSTGVKEGAKSLGRGLLGGFAEFGYGTLQGLTGPIGQKIAGKETSNISTILAQQGVSADNIQKYKDMVMGGLEQKNIKVTESKNTFFQKHPDLLPKYTTGLFTAIKNGDTAQLKDPAYWTDMVGRGLGQMLPSLAVALATKNPNLALVSFFPQQVQDAYEDVNNDPDIQLNKSQKQSYALGLGAVTTVIENLSFGVVAKPFLKLVRKEALDMVMRSPLKVGLKQLLSSMGAEGIEEVLQQLTTNVLAKVFGSKRNAFDVNQYADAFAGGFIGSLGMGIGGGGISSYRQRQTNQQIQGKQPTFKEFVENKVNIGLSVKDISKQEESIPKDLGDFMDRFQKPIGKSEIAESKELQGDYTRELVENNIDEIRKEVGVDVSVEEAKKVYISDVMAGEIENIMPDTFFDDGYNWTDIRDRIESLPDSKQAQIISDHLNGIKDAKDIAQDLLLVPIESVNPKQILAKKESTILENPTPTPRKAGEIKPSNIEKIRIIKRKGVKNPTEFKKEKEQKNLGPQYPMVQQSSVEQLFPSLFFPGMKEGVTGEGVYAGVIAKPTSKRKDIKSFSSGIKNVAQPINTMISNISRNIGKLYNKMEFRIKNLESQYVKDSSIGIKQLNIIKKKNKKDFDDLTIALYNEDLDKIRELSAKYPGLEHNIESIRTLILKDAYRKSQEVGFKYGEMDAYRPFRVRDIEGLFKAIEEKIGTAGWTTIQRAIAEKEKKLNIPAGTLDINEQARIADSMMRGYYNQNITIGSKHFKSRRLTYLDKNLAQYYYNPIDSLQLYIKSIPTTIYAKQLFGGSHTDTNDLMNSVGYAVLQLGKQNGLSMSDQQKLKELIQIRLSHKGTDPIVSAVKNFVYLLTLVNPMSALTQVGDLTFSIYENGVGLALKTIFKHKLINMEDIGILSYNIEMIDNKLGSSILNVGLKSIGFESMDRLGKEVMINSTLYKLINRAKTNPAKLMAQLELYGTESNIKETTEVLRKIGDIINDTKLYNNLGKRMSRRKTNKFISNQIKEIITEDIKEILFSNIAKFQPIHEGRMTPTYLSSSGWTRMIYQLKTFNITALDGILGEGRKQFQKAKLIDTKQLALIDKSKTETDVIEKARLLKEAKRLGKVKKLLRTKGVRNIVLLIFMMTAMSFGVREIKDFIKGLKTPRWKLATNSFLANFGVSIYDFNGGAYGDSFIENILQGQIIPGAVGVADNYIQTLWYIGKQLVNGKEIDVKKFNVLKNTPFGGDLPYQFLKEDNARQDREMPDLSDTISDISSFIGGLSMGGGGGGKGLTQSEIDALYK